MSGSKEINKCFIHVCDSEKVSIMEHVKPLDQMGFSDSDYKSILRFYLFNAPILDANKEIDKYGAKSLRYYGWTGNAELMKLEGLLLSAAGIGVFCIIKADGISETLKAMDLSDEICVQHPRAVLLQKYSVTVHENGEISINEKETRLQCLLRHMRNSLAHNRTYGFEIGNILFEDIDDNGKISARILMPKEVLLEWIRLIDKNNRFT